MGIDSGSTNRWKTARERNRLKARYEIQSRVSQLVQNDDDIMHKEDQSMTTTAPSRRLDDYYSLDEMNMTLKYLQAIIKNDVSTFSITSLARHQNDIRQYKLINGPLPNINFPSSDDDTTLDLSCGVPKQGTISVHQAEYALAQMISTNIPWNNSHTNSHHQQSQPVTLATSKYGRSYLTERLIPYMQYLQSQNDNLTLMEYASLVGRYQIVGLLLLGGVDPTMMRMVNSKCQDGKVIQEGVEQCYYRAKDSARRRVLSYFHCLHTNDELEGEQQQQKQRDGNEFESSTKAVRIPMSIWQYLIRAIVEMRMNGALGSTNIMGQTVYDAANVCSLCHMQHQSSSCHQGRHPMLLNFGAPCNHSYCEPCMWMHLLKHIPHCTDLKSKLVTCPVCNSEFNGFRYCEKGDLNHTRQRGEGVGCDPTTDLSTKEDNGIKIEEKKDEVVLSSTTSTTMLQEREERRLQSYTKFMALAATSTELKSKSQKKHKSSNNQQINQQKFNSKRRKEKDPTHSTWEEALLPMVESQLSRDVRSDRFFKAVSSSSIQLVIIYLNAGIDVDMKNEYGQTPLYIACWKGSIEIVRWLLYFGADVSINANGGSSCHDVARIFGRVDVMELLMQYTDPSIPPFETLLLPLPGRGVGNDNFEVTTLIDSYTDHPGAGACIVDGALTEDQLCFLDLLQQSLPVIEACEEELGGGDKSYSDKSNRPSRSYYCDVDHKIQQMLEGTVEAARQAVTREVGDEDADTTSGVPKSIFQHIRFLKYEQKGGVLPPHVDLCRVDEKSGQRSTHTFILYLTDCTEGGGTALLEHLKTPSVLAVAQPKRGRALIFPHNCPHSGLEVDCVPKVLLRGEVIL
jgi:ankyrin repeat protein